MPEPLSQATNNYRSHVGLIWRAIAFGIVSLSIAAGIGYYAWNLRADHLVTVGKLKFSEQTSLELGVERQKNENLLTRLATCEGGLQNEQERCRGVELSATTIQGDLNASQSEIDSLRKHREEASRRLAAFEEMTAKFQKMIDNGKVDVINRNGRLLVKLPAGVLFSSGSAELSRAGELALMEVAIVLRQFTDRSFMVEGHTDDRPLEDSKQSRFANNWELSTARAVTVTRFLVEARMSPQNLVAAGHAAYDPVSENRTAKGRQENRRIEIVMLPNLEKLPSLEGLPGVQEASSTEDQRTAPHRAPDPAQETEQL